MRPPPTTPRRTFYFDRPARSADPTLSNSDRNFDPAPAMWLVMIAAVLSELVTELGAWAHDRVVRILGKRTAERSRELGSEFCISGTPRLSYS